MWLASTAVLVVVYLILAILESAAQGGAPVKTDWGYKRAVDPATVVDIVA